MKTLFRGKFFIVSLYRTDKDLANTGCPTLEVKEAHNWLAKVVAFNFVRTVTSVHIYVP